MALYKMLVPSNLFVSLKFILHLFPLCFNLRLFSYFQRNFVRVSVGIALILPVMSKLPWRRRPAGAPDQYPHQQAVFSGSPHRRPPLPLGMLSEQPAHNAFFMGKRLSAGMLIAEATLGEELRGLYVQYDQFVSFCVNPCAAYNSCSAL